jgi:hypothetical protein
MQKLVHQFSHIRVILDNEDRVGHLRCSMQTVSAELTHDFIRKSRARMPPRPFLTLADVTIQNIAARERATAVRGCGCDIVCRSVSAPSGR